MTNENDSAEEEGMSGRGRGVGVRVGWNSLVGRC